MSLKFLEQTTNNFIGGAFVPSQSGETFTNTSSWNQKPLSQVARSGAADVDAAVKAAQIAQPGWADLGVAKRADWLEKIADAIDANLEDLAKLEALDTGKPITETRHGDIPRVALNFRFYASLARKHEERTYTSEDGSRHIVSREPLGIAGLITPWNLPLYLETWKIAPALVTGNAVIIKPAELTPLSANALGRIVSELGLPAGILNIVHGYGEKEAGEALVAHPDIACISFTGETTTGKAIMATAAQTLKKVSFELGGKGASVVFADADLQAALKPVVTAAFKNQGQVCLAGSRLIVEESVADEFVAEVVKAAKEIRLGDPLAEETTMGALISVEHRDKVSSYVEYARQQKFKIECGGKIPESLKGGAYYEPTVISGVSQDSRLIQEEIFGPVLTVQTFKTKEEALALLNGTKFGLSCSVYSQNDETLQFMSQKARFGMIWQNAWFLRNLNTPFGGMKQSGVGREGGEYSLNFFSESKTISSPQGKK